MMCDNVSCYFYKGLDLSKMRNAWPCNFVKIFVICILACLPCNGDHVDYFHFRLILYSDVI